MLERLRDSCKELFSLAYAMLKSAGIKSSQWSFGGGTALMLYYGHRLSKDIDIFLSDAQLITYLTPRLNDFVSERIVDHTEMSYFLKLTILSGEIDFILAPVLTKNPFTYEQYGSDYVRVETPEEIIIKKIFYKAEQLKGRDIFDLATVIYHDKEVLLRNSDIIKAKVSTLLDRISMLERDYNTEVQKLDILDISLRNFSAPDLVKDFLNQFSQCGATI